MANGAFVCASGEVSREQSASPALPHSANFGYENENGAEDGDENAGGRSGEQSPYIDNRNGNGDDDGEGDGDGNVDDFDAQDESYRAPSTDVAEHDGYYQGQGRGVEGGPASGEFHDDDADGGVSANAGPTGYINEPVSGELQDDMED
jgi:hypothetical protein